MAGETLGRLALEPYFALLQRIYPDAAAFWLCSADGEVLDAAPGCGAEPAPAAPAVETPAPAGVPTDCHLRVSADGCIWSSEIHDFSDRPVGRLIGRFPAPGPAEAAGFERVAGLIEHEFRLQQELNDMTLELSLRYEELNLIYDHRETPSRAEEVVDNIRALLKHYTEHVELDMVALICPKLEQRLYATRDAGCSMDTETIMQRLERNLLPAVRGRREVILGNRPGEGGYDIPCKLIAWPVFNSRTDLEGILVCLNHPQGSDFFSSDRSLLSVIAYKIEKINQVNFDALTHLMNLQSFRRSLQHLLERPEPEDLPLCLLDVDIHQLRIVNDTFGRPAGDRVIEHIAGILAGNLRKSDIICYRGEGRFSVLLKCCSAEQAQVIARKLDDQVRHAPTEWCDNRVDVQINTGIAPVDEAGSSADDLLETAELARLTATKGGSEQIQLYRTDDVELLAHRQDMQIVTRIREAMRDDALLLYCQTIQPVMPSGEHYHMEILARMTGSDGSILRPDLFIRVAEKFNLMTQLDRWIIRATLAQLATAGVRSGITSINLSGQSLANGQLADYIEQQLQEYAIDPAAICFEITETVAIGNRQVALGMINRLRSLGCRFSLDDFGTGLSSFSYLRELPVDYVKIDGSFIREMLHDRVAHAMVASIIQIAHIMGLRTVAEFVENRALAERLTSMGVDYLQGYGIHQPQPLQDYLAALPGSRTAARTG